MPEFAIPAPPGPPTASVNEVEPRPPSIAPLLISDVIVPEFAIPTPPAPDPAPFPATPTRAHALSGIERRGPLERSRGPWRRAAKLKPLASPAQALKDRGPSRIGVRRLLRAPGYRREELRAERVGRAARRLSSCMPKRSANGLVEPFQPRDGPNRSRGVDELDVDARSAACALNAALEDVRRNVRLAADLFRIAASALARRRQYCAQ